MKKYTITLLFILKYGSISITLQYAYAILNLIRYFKSQLDEVMHFIESECIYAYILCSIECCIICDTYTICIHKM